MKLLISSFLRVKSLQVANFAMRMVFPERSCLFVGHGLKEKKGNIVSEVQEFAEKHHYFSLYHPLVGVVTDKEQDVWIVADLLKTIYDKVPDSEQTLMTEEVLTKILAFRALREGMELLIPYKKKLVRYTVEKILYLDKGMPAFCLTAENQMAPSFLLFRGTELSWKGRRSVVSDLDYKGAGYSCFMNAREKITSWLKKAHHPHALGYSLGGIFSAYTLIFYPEFVHEATAFSPPGLLRTARKQWQEYPLDSRLHVYVTRGDCIPKYGTLVGNIKELSLDKKLLPLTAHTLFVTAQPSFFIAPASL